MSKAIFTEAMETAEIESDSNEEVIVSSTDLPNVLQQPKPLSHHCKICHATAIHSNYGAMTCSPCKMFFKRNAAMGQKQFTCNFGGHCVINVNNRHICPSCRLATCFLHGMQAELIRCPLSKKNLASRNQDVVMESATPTSNILVKTTEQHHLQMLPTKNLSQSDNSTISTDQWTVLSNLINIFDESKLLSIIQQFLSEHDVSQSMEMSDPTLPNAYFMQIYETSGAYMRSNHDLRTLASDDRPAFLRNTANNVICLGAALCWSLSQVYNCKHFVHICTNIYGEEAVPLVKHVMKFIDSDIVIVKLAISLFAFCNNSSIFSTKMTMKTLNTLAIFHIQNTYAEITWGYLIYKYGYHESILRFINLVECLLAATNTVSDAQNIEKHVNDTELLVEQIELEFLLDDIDGNKN